MPASSAAHHRRKSSQKAPPSAAEKEKHQYHKREKTKSSQSYIQRPPHDASLQAAAAAAAPRPGLNQRSNSAPLVPKLSPSTQTPEKEAERQVDDAEDTLSGEDLESDEEEEEEEIAEDPFFQRYNLPTAEEVPEDANTDESEDEPEDTEGPLSPTSTHARARPDSTAEPLASPRSPISLSHQTGPMHEINIAVLGATGVGKSYFIQRSFDVYNTPLLAVTSRKMSIDGSIYTVRLLEIPFEDLEVEEDNCISWPDTLDDMHMPQIDGVLTLYDVMDKDSLSEVPEFL
ncbi:hypothetical protein LTS18_002646, partial [Coniosporium uncinatum]